MNWRITDPGHLLEAVRISLDRGREFLLSRMAPNGPILRERNLSYVHKTTWGLYVNGADHDTIARMLDWTQREALRENGDFYFPEEPPEYKDMQRLYRALNLGKVAAWLNHPLILERRILDRILQYQHKPSGGVFHYLGDDPDHPDLPATLGTLDTTFFGHLMLALGLRDRARAAGDWVRTWVDANRQHMAEGQLFTCVTPEGELVTDVEPGEKLSKVVDTRDAQQPFWPVGTAMAYLAVLYETMRECWGAEEQEARPYLESAIALLDFEATMPLDTYLWPSKCKVGWGAGELLRVLVQYAPDGQDLIEQAYRIAERVAVFTFMDNQLSHGGWSCMHYPLSELIPERAFSYKPLKDIVSVPTEPIPDSQTIFLPSEEITAEFVGEMKSIETGIAAWLAAQSE